MQGNEPRKEVVLDRTVHHNLVGLAEKLEAIAKSLKEAEHFTIVDGQKEVVIHPQAPLEVEYKFERKGGKYHFDLDVEWQAGAKTPDIFTIK